MTGGVQYRMSYVHGTGNRRRQQIWKGIVRPRKMAAVSWTAPRFLPGVGVGGCSMVGGVGTGWGAPHKEGQDRRARQGR